MGNKDEQGKKEAVWPNIFLSRLQLGRERIKEREREGTLFLNTRRIERGMACFLGLSSRGNKVGVWRERKRERKKRKS